METKKLKGKWVITPKKNYCGYLLAIYHRDFTIDYINVWASEIDKKFKELDNDISVIDVKVFGKLDVDFEPEINGKEEK